jgi:hypothetical protein
MHTDATIASAIILITTCRKNIQKQELLRAVLKNSGIEYYFLLGGSDRTFLKGDTLHIDVIDTYEMLHLKVVKGLLFFRKHKKNILKIDDDSFLDIKRLKEYNFNFDYGGFFHHSGRGPFTYHAEKVTDKRYSSTIESNLIYDFCNGGGYFLSLKAQKLFFKNYKTSEEYSNHLRFLKGREDRLIGQTLYPFFKNLVIKKDGYSLTKHKENFIFSAFNDAIIHPVEEDIFKKMTKYKFPKYSFYKDIISKKI